jgi:hypothetical protein
LQRSENKGCAHREACTKNRNPIVFCCQWGEYVSGWRFWREQVFLGKEMGVFPWLIAIFGEHVDLPQSTP